MEWYNIVSVIVTFLFSGSGIIYFFNIRQERKKLNGLAMQEDARGKDLVISSTENLINLVNKTLLDKESIWESEKNYFTSEIKILNDKIDNLSKLVQEKDSNLSEQNKLIKIYVDKESVWESEKAKLMSEIKILNDKIDNLSKLVQEKDFSLNEQNILIKKYLAEQSELKTEIELLRKMLLNNSSTLNIIAGDLDK
jgi:chromosome segregation ATPase